MITENLTRDLDWLGWISDADGESGDRLLMVASMLVVNCFD